MPDSQNPANRMNEFMEAKQSGPNCNVYGSGIFLKLGNAADLLPKVNRIKISLFFFVVFAITVFLSLY